MAQRLRRRRFAAWERERGDGAERDGAGAEPERGRRARDKARGVASPPWAAKTEASTATPSTPPSSRIAMLAPAAWPCSTGRTAPSTAWEIGAKNAPLPRPIRISGATRLR